MHWRRHVLLFYFPAVYPYMDLVCDGAKQCHSGEDESPLFAVNHHAMYECVRRGGFFCNISQECIRMDWVCDGSIHCRSDEDESPLFCSTDACHKLDVVFCNVSRKCIHKDWICDGDNDCRNGEDEAASACTLKQYCESKWSVYEGCLGRCKSGYFGKYCDKNCSEKCVNGICNIQSGFCKNCTSGYFGTYCNRTCSKNCVNGICNSSTGICKDCTPGYSGMYCEKPCSNKCLNGICNSSSGICKDCKPGYFGIYCEKTCSKECLNGICYSSSGISKDCSRTYLKSCSLECGKECRERDGFPQCDRLSGTCLNGCFLNHYGQFCNVSCKNCKINSYITLCDDNGVCLYGCENGYWDKKCNTKCSANCQGDEHGNRCNSSTDLTPQRSL